MAWLPGWDRRIQLTIDSGDIDGALTDFPVMVYLSASSGLNSRDVSAVFDELTSDANRLKIAVTTSDGLTECYVEIKTWDDANEKAWLFVRVPSVASGSDTVLYLYYDADHADNTTYVGDPNSAVAETVWGSTCHFISHMKDDPDTSHIRDSSEYDNDGTKTGANQPQEEDDAVLAEVQRYDTNTDLIAANGVTGVVDVTHTLIVWAKSDSYTTNRAVIASGRTDATFRYSGIFRKSDNKYYAESSRGSGSINSVASAATYNNDTTWHCFAVSFATGTGHIAYFLIDGVDEGSASGVSHDIFPTVFYIGQRPWNTANNYPWSGDIALPRVYSGELAVAWGKACYESERDDLITFGHQEVPPGYSTLLIDSTNVLFARDSLSVELRIEERSIASFTVVDSLGIASFIKGQPVLIYDITGVLVFGGIVDNPEKVAMAPAGGLYHMITCADWHYLADKRLIAESYLATTAGAIVTDIHAKYLAAEGITLGTIEAGPEIVEAVFNYVSASEAYDALKEKAGKIWYIDEHKALYFVDRTTTAAPWNATTADMIKNTARLSGGNPKYRNRQYIRGGRGTTALLTEKFVADGLQNAFTLSFPLAKVPTFVEVNAVDKTPLGIKGLDAPGDFASYWNKGDPTIYLTDVPTAGWIVEIRYYGQFPILVLAQDTDAIVDQLAIEGAGTGYVDDISDEPKLTDKDASIDAAQAKLAKYAVVGKRFLYDTLTTGLKPGQLQTVDYSRLGLNSASMLIEAVTIRGFGANNIHEVTAIQGPAMGSWSDLFKTLAHMKHEVLERLNVGSEQVLIILVESAENWGWTESVSVTITACPFPAATLYPEATLYPC